MRQTAYVTFLSALHSFVVLMNRHLIFKNLNNPRSHAHHKIHTQLHSIVTENTYLSIVKRISLGFWLGIDLR